MKGIQSACSKLLLTSILIVGLFSGPLHARQDPLRKIISSGLTPASVISCR
jgi:hypothetical protein